MKEKLKTNKGITLIALVVTIIVLLILATVTISIITGDDGVIDQAESAKEATERSQWEDRIDIAILNAKGNNEEVTMDIIIQELINRGIISDASKVDKTTGDITTNDPSYVISGKLDDYIPFGPGIEASKNQIYKDSEGNTATIPKGFTVSTTENTISSGLVVYGPDDSEFVWVPVDKINDMAQCSTAGGSCDLELQKDGTLKCETHGSTEIVGKLYTIGTGNFGTANTTYSADSGSREPAILENYDNGADNTVGMKLDGLKSEYKAMATSVAKNKGFYVGRYETSLTTATPTSPGTSGDVQSKAGVIPTSANNIANSNWYGLYSKLKTYETTSVQSSMIWGSQYDAIMNWALKGDDASKVKVTGNGNHSGDIVTAGNSSYSKDSINNIRDLDGNLWEWTLEASDKNFRVVRGGAYDASISCSPSEREMGSSGLPTRNYDYTGSRLTLYIK